MSSEARRLVEDRPPGTPWKKWGPYLSERQWGTVREDYSDLGQWLHQHGLDPRNPRLQGTRNGAWAHMVNEDIISMPDKWEYPWYAAWDLAFHTVALALVDLDFAKPTGVICCSSTSTSTGTTDPVSAPAIRPAGLPW